MKEMTAAGVGVCVKRADPISPDDELRLWNSGGLRFTKGPVPETGTFATC